MFERYDQPARRVLFFARYEASQLGSLTIETEHLLLGLLREPGGPLSSLLAGVPLSEVRKEIEAAVPFQEKLATSVEIPFSKSVKRALGHAAEEADKLQDPRIGTEHLLLGVLGDETSIAATALHRYGLRLDDARARARETASSSRVASEPDVRGQMAQIRELLNQVKTSLSADREAVLAIELMTMDLQRLITRLGEP
jgi:ATP-dependent Clp protease ATP-binding subunit ClpC